MSFLSHRKLQRQMHWQEWAEGYQETNTNYYLRPSSHTHLYLLQWFRYLQAQPSHFGLVEG